MQGAPAEKFETRVQAVAALQAEYRRSVGSPEFKRLHEKEPCPWLALAGKCKEKKCRPCASGISFDDAMLNGVRARASVGSRVPGCPRLADTAKASAHGHGLRHAHFL
ncbi:hypothetical protein AB1Y20_018226 [Prymnesium parvum]|uniref:Uncharacterized protein n=1 Tax=Prymnesium parvum TaxID=97485 RepID=A0AB34JRE8_PRYPA